MYTRKFGDTESSARKETSSGYANPYFDEKSTYLIPPEYHGEMLRRPPEEVTAPPASPPMMLRQRETDAEDAAPAPTQSPEGHRMTDGIFDLLLGKNSDEEETVLLLGIAVMLLSGHLERRESGWGEDDLALLLIGYLLLG